MTTHQYLNQIYRLQKKIESLELYEERLRSEAEQVSAPPFDKTRVMGSGPRDTSAVIARLVDCEAEIVSTKLEMIAKRDKIVGEIYQLGGESEENEHFVEVLTRRYILFEKYNVIAEKMNFTEKHVYRIRKAALAAFERKYGGEYVDA